MNEWSQKLKKAEEKSDFEAREERTLRIMRDPKPHSEPPVRKPYETTEFHYILCVDEENANLSMPEAGELYNSPHKVGGLLVSDRKEIPLGWIKAPPKGTPVDVLAEKYPEAYEALVDKKVTQF